ncbi:hypothetical protein ACFQ9J_15290 [Streptomyces sp. NPDC056529]|uniref:hypothetical protein n=1 Tax=Streptomyces sp. NPDC056529 TaxID=3345855 RepID=UPI0036C90F71
MSRGASSAGLHGEDLLGAAGRRVGDQEHHAVAGGDRLDGRRVRSAAPGVLVQRREGVEPGPGAFQVLQGVRSDVKVTSDYGTYRVIAFESGTFTNHGDGGWINRGFKGWFDRDGGSVTF